MAATQRTKGPGEANAVRAEHFFGSRGELARAIEQAEMAADNDWEVEFVSGMQVRFDKYGLEMFMSQTQADKLREIAER